MEKRDFLAECLADTKIKVTPAELEMALCRRCLQKECTRSQAGTSRFEQRTNTWFERLFEKPMRMSEDDPRFSKIRSQRFLDVLQETPYEIGRGSPPASSWLDPRDLDGTPPTAQAPVQIQPPPTSLVSEPASAPSEIAPLDAAPKAPDTDPSMPLLEEPPSKAATPEPLPLSPSQLRNTPFRQGAMIAGREPPKTDTKQPAPVYDPWAPTKPRQTDGVQIVKPGAKIKLG